MRALFGKSPPVPPTEPPIIAQMTKPGASPLDRRLDESPGSSINAMRSDPRWQSRSRASRQDDDSSAERQIRSTPTTRSHSSKFYSRRRHSRISRASAASRKARSKTRSTLYNSLKSSTEFTLEQLEVIGDDVIRMIVVDNNEIKKRIQTLDHLRTLVTTFTKKAENNTREEVLLADLEDMLKAFSSIRPDDFPQLSGSKRKSLKK